MKWLSDYWSYVKFLVSGDDGKEMKLMGIKLVADEYCPRDKMFLASVNSWAKENEGVSILAINLWNEGMPCDHRYRKVKASKSHASAVEASGVHKDYICSKCGQPFCSVVSKDAVDLANVWATPVVQKPTGVS